MTSFNAGEVSVTSARPRQRDVIVWPSTAHYKRALRRPVSAFNDPELKSLELDVDVMGMPSAVEGQSAVVFFGQTEAGRIAVRCLKRPVAYGERRYVAMGSHIAGWTASPLATVEWQNDGVKVDDRWWPIVRMELVDGVSMRQYISAHLYDSDGLYALGDQWRDLCSELRHHDVAHADLQQDNVRVLNGGALRLIDLDAVWVPALEGMPPREFGHRHFQHPERLRTGHWDGSVDAFSALVIYISIRALASDPSLWDEYHNDENLVFSDTDFEHPGATPIWSRLAASRDLEVRDLLLVLDRFCRQTVRVEIDLPTILQTRTFPAGEAYVVSGAPLSRSEWWMDRASRARAATPAPSWPQESSSAHAAQEQAVPTWPASQGAASTGIVDQWPYSLADDLHTARRGPKAAKALYTAKPISSTRAVLIALAVVAAIVIAILLGSTN